MITSIFNRWQSIFLFKGQLLTVDGIIHVLKNARKSLTQSLTTCSKDESRYYCDFALAIDDMSIWPKPVLWQITFECRYRNHSCGLERHPLVQPLVARGRNDSQGVAQVLSACEGGTRRLMSRMLINNMSVSHNQFIIKTTMGSALKWVYCNPLS